MAKLPRTPDLARLRDTPPSLRTVGGIRLHRIYQRSGGYPTLWNSFRHVGPLSRFDHHNYYRSSLTNRPAVALYERANQPDLFSTNPVFHRALADPTLHRALATVGDEIGHGLN